MADIIIYQANDGRVTLDVNLVDGSLWLSQQQMAALFGTQRQAITKHLKNIFETKESRENSTSSILGHMAKNGRKYQARYYNLDAIIPVGYRVNSSQVTQNKLTDYWKDHGMGKPDELAIFDKYYSSGMV